MGGSGFEDVLAANEDYARNFALAGLTGRAAKGLAVITCIDSRIEPLAMLGLRAGDAKILRNAGARVDDGVLATLVLAMERLDVERVMVVGHTDCAAGGGGDETIREDVERIRTFPALADLAAGGFRYDVETGLLSPVL